MKKNTTNSSKINSDENNSVSKQILKEINRLEYQAEYYRQLLFKAIEELDAADEFKEFQEFILDEFILARYRIYNA
ncbi:MAG: hypothetical protein GYB32_04420 [Algicola sp.]|nr:hypothetical protein [Algicola sp.]